MKTNELPAADTGVERMRQVLQRELSGHSLLEISARGNIVGRIAAEQQNRRVRCVQLGRDVNDVAPGQCALDANSPDPLEDWTSQSFDDVVCVEALEKTRHPFLFLDQLADVTRRRLIIEVSDLGATELKRIRLNWWRRWLVQSLRRFPLAFVSPNSLRTNRQTVYLSVESIRRFLAEHRQSFCRVRVVPSPRNGKSLIVADKRRIRRLVVIAGPTSAGKSTLMDKIQQGQLETLCERIDLDERDKWEPKELYEIIRDSRNELDRIMMHYDFTTRLKWNMNLCAMTDFMDIVRSADRVSIVTLWTEPEQLREQFEENEIQRHVEARGEMPTNRKTLRLREDYQDPANILRHYQDWFQFAQSLTKSQYIVSQSSEVMTLAEWSEKHSVDLSVVDESCSR